MKKYSAYIDIALVASLFAAIAAPSFALVNGPSLGSAAGYPIIDTATQNAQARADAQTAYTELMGRGCTSDMTGVNMNNQRLYSGIHCFSTGTVLNGQVLLDAQGDSNSVFIFRMNQRFDVWANATVVLTNGARPENIFWVVAGPVTIGTNVQLAGTVISMNSITLGVTSGQVFDDRGSVNGRLWSVGSTVSVSPRAPIGFFQPLVNVIYPTPQATYQAPQYSYAPQQGTSGYLTVSSNEVNFALFVDGSRVTSGQRYSFPAGTHTVTEINFSGAEYGAPSYSGGCAQNGLAGAVVLNAGDEKTCIVTNTPSAYSPAYVSGYQSSCMNGCQPVCDGGCPGLPNTGADGAYLPVVSMIGLLLITGFVWQETRSIKALS